MKSYLVTGGCGFIGVNLVSRLAGRGARVRILDNLSLGKREDVAPLGIDLRVGDIRDMAAFLRACHDAGVKKVIFASTGGAILGEQVPPVHEGMVPRPVSPYGASKLVGEAYCSAFCGSFGLNTVALRFSNVYGPFSYHKGSVVAQFFRNLIQEEPLVIYGDGQQTRDFLYVDDLVDAVLLADKSETPGEVFQIASGRETSLKDLLAAMKRVLPAVKFDVRYEPARAGEILRNYASIEKARRLLGYNPSKKLDDGLRDTWSWFVSQNARAASSQK